MKFSIILCSDMHMDLEKANNLIACILSNPSNKITSDYTKADIIIIMTCAFGPKKEYSMYVIADVIRNAKPDCRIIATGCLEKINNNELKVIPRLEVKDFNEVITMLENRSPHSYERKIHQNNVIISNGCLKKCSYCVYPLIEQEYTSKYIEEILEEVEELYTKEPFICITGAHETSDYGIDIYGKRRFADLMNEICTKFPDCNYIIGWFHPTGLTDEVMDVIAKNKNIVQIMTHIQHNDDEILKNMNRPSFEKTYERIQKLHSLRPDLLISTEVIVGFPGETDEKFNNLVKLLDGNVFQDIGVASYEPVLNTKAALLPNLPEYNVRNKRMEIIQEKFNATGYPASMEIKPVLSSYFEGIQLLSQIPTMCIRSSERQEYDYIAGTDTLFKINLWANFSRFIENMLKDITEARDENSITKLKNKNKKYTQGFKTWMYKLISLEISENEILVKRARRVLLNN